VNDDAWIPGRQRDGRPVVLDACVLICLAATGSLEEILRSAAPAAVVTRQVLDEALFWRVATPDGFELRSIDLGPAMSAGLVQAAAFATDAEAELFLDLAMQMETGEAASAAVAIHRNCWLATDERKVIRLAGDRIGIIGTLDLVRDWGLINAVDDARMRELLLRIRQQRYRPASTHRHFTWWQQMLGE
jgi:predicted nucleic acid-binding protein